MAPPKRTKSYHGEQKYDQIQVRNVQYDSVNDLMIELRRNEGIWFDFSID